MPASLERRSGVATITFSAPPLNLYSLALHDDLDAVLDEVEADLPRALVIRAEGRAVSAGVDVGEFFARKDRAATQELYDRMIELPDRVAALDVPTFFAAHALTLTWAFEVALACDVILAAESAKFGLVERVIGLTPTMGGTQRLAGRAGVGRAKELVFTGSTFDAATMERWNVVNRVLPDATFDADVDAFVEQIAIGPTQAFGAAKRVLRHFESGGVPEANAHVTSLAADLFATEDLQAGMRSFLEDGPGKAEFSGR